MRWLGVLVVVLTTMIVLPVAAQPTPKGDSAGAQALFDQGLERLKVDDWAGACPQFEASNKLEVSVGATVNIARCAEHNGELARAWAEFKRAKSLNLELSPEPRKKKVEEFIDERLSAIEPRLPWITVRVSARPEGLAIVRDGLPFPIEGLAVAVPIDPGKHVFRVSAPGYRTITQEVTLAEGAKQEITLRLEIDPEAATAIEPAPPNKLPVGRGPTPSQGPNTLVLTGGILSGVGGLGLVIAAITGGVALADRSTLDQLVDDGDCREDLAAGTISCSSAARKRSHDAIARGEPLALTSTITLFAGGAIAAAGIALVIAGATSDSGADKTALIPLFLAGGGGVSLAGSFQ